MGSRSGTVDRDPVITKLVQAYVKKYRMISMAHSVLGIPPRIAGSTGCGYNYLQKSHPSICGAEVVSHCTRFFYVAMTTAVSLPVSETRSPEMA